jgi:protocatechuate 3,4-dioxygenase beta subunit
MKLKLVGFGLLLLCSLLSIGMSAEAQTSQLLSPEIAARRAMILRGLDQMNRSNGSQLPYRTTATRPTNETKGGARILGGGTPQGSIAGHVTGAIAPNGVIAQVVAFSTDSMESVALFGKVDADGSYTIPGVPVGTYYVLADAPGYQTMFYDNTTDISLATPVTVLDGQVTRNINFAMQNIPTGTGSISGRVTRESDGRPIANAMIFINSSDNPCGSYVTTDENGNYLIEGLVSGNYMVYASAEGYLGEYYDNAYSPDKAAVVQVAEPNRTSNVSFALGLGATITGRVVDTKGDPIAGAYVVAYQDLSASPTDSTGVIGNGSAATTDDNGNYTISGLVGGSYIVEAMVWNQWFTQEQWYSGSPTPEGASPVFVQIGQTRSGVDFRFDVQSFSGVISGVAKDLNGVPLAGVQVMVEPTDRNDKLQVWAYGMTGDDGTYIIEGLPDGEYIVSAFAENGWDFVMQWWDGAESPEDATPVVIASGTTTPSSVDFTLDLKIGTAAIAGTVRRSDGTPVAGASVMVMGTDPATGGVMNKGGYAVTDEYGNYMIEKAFAGSYIVYASYWGEDGVGEQWYLNADDPSKATPVELADGETRKGVDFTLDIRNIFGSVAGRITDRTTGAPIAGAYVEVYSMDADPNGNPGGLKGGGFGGPSSGTITDDDGYYQIDGLIEGKYMMAAISDNAYGFYQDADMPEDADAIEIVAGTKVTANTSLRSRPEGTGVISGYVYDEESRPVDMAMVMAMPTDLPFVLPYTATADPDGSYGLTGLPDGDYLVLAFSYTHVGEYYDNVFDPSEATPVRVMNGGIVSGISFNLAEMDTIYWDAGKGGPAAGGSIYGKVTDPSGRALSNATVYAVDASQKPVAFARTSIDGSYDLGGLPTGAGYRVFASRAGYTSAYNGDAGNFSEAAPMAVNNNRTQIDITLLSKTSSVEERPTTGSSIQLSGNRPNPFGSDTRISFSLAKPMHVHVTVVNMLGEKVADLFNGTLNAGPQEIRWNGENGAGAAMESGLYFYRIENGTEATGGTMTLTR